MAKLMPIDGFILHIFKLPFMDSRVVIRSVFKYEDGDYDESFNQPKTKCKRSVVAWALMIAYRESPVRFLFGATCLLIVLPSLVLANIFL